MGSIEETTPQRLVWAAVKRGYWLPNDKDSLAIRTFAGLLARQWCL